jgi:uncharacterized protein YeaO (DUF488 family)
MLKETYLGNWRKIPEGVEKIYVTRTAKSVLSPSNELLNDYKGKRIDWAQYTERFIEEMKSEKAINEMRRIKELARTKDVYLICYEKPPDNCHRFLLMDMIKELK